MKKTLQVVGSLNIGGAETLLLNFARAIPRARAEELAFLVFGDSIGAYEEELLSLGCSIYRIRRPFPIAPWVFDHDFANLCRMTGGFGAVHSHINFASGVVLTAARRQNVPIRIAHAHTESSLDTSFLRSIYHALSRKVILRNNTQLFACSDQSGRYLFGEEWDTSGVLIHNAVDVSRFQGVHGRRNVLRAQLGLSAETLAIGVFSRVVDVKNLGFLLAVLEQDHATPPMHLLGWHWAGTGFTAKAG
ncbi:MAG: glycosyltransferase [Nocardioidaceae bacterium]